MSADRSTEVLIAGAGPVGLFAALTLARRGVGVRIVDTGVWACSHSYALALHPQTLPLFREAGLLDEVLAHSNPVRSLALADSSGPRARVALDGPSGECLAVLRQDGLEGMLEKALARYGVKVEWRREVSRLEPGPDAVSVGIDRYEKESRGYVIAHTEWVVAGSSSEDVRYVVGADGYNSRVRRALGYDFPEVGPAEYFAVFEFESDAQLNGEVTVVLNESGTRDVLWPLPRGVVRWSFLLPGYSDPDVEEIKNTLESTGFGHFPTERLKDRVFQSSGVRDPNLGEEHLRRFIRERAPWFQASIGPIAWSSVVRFERRLATGFGRDRLWLAGDSAHLTGPLGVQSMNAGLLEAHELATALAGILRGGEPPAVLGAYAARCMSNWKQLHGAGGGLHPGPETDPWVASHSSELLSALPASGAALGTLAAKLGLAF